jgi:Glycosyl hydrolase family 57
MRIRSIFLVLISVFLLTGIAPAQKIHIAFLWHMHQPNYFPGETIIETEAANHYDYSIYEIHTTRNGPYTTWPADAVQMGIDAGMPHFGAQVSFTGSLVENLNELENEGVAFSNWHQSWNQMSTATTTLGNPRIDMVGFGYFHPLMGLLWSSDIEGQITRHRLQDAQEFDGDYSNGIFPPENAFSPLMIPSLVDQGLDWVLVDNIHFDRACVGYPWNNGGSVVEVNASEVQNPNPGDWVALNGLWAPTQVSAQWGHQPHWVEHVDPATGQTSRIIAVPASRYLGNEDGRGGFGALQYDLVMSQLEPFNTDPDHPILVVLHHDGDNHGGGTDSYYHNNFQAFVNWLAANDTRFECTTIEDYLERFPPDQNDVIHVEPGSWAGADAGDPEFKKWLGDPWQGYSPDINSWGVITAAKHIVNSAWALASNNADVREAARYLHMGEASDYWYWDGAQDGIWDTHPTRAANLAVPLALPYANQSNAAPTIFLPQREPYNPGATEWGDQQSASFDVWTYVYDLDGLESVQLMIRADGDGINDPNTTANETYSGGAGVGNWQTLPMNAIWIEPQTNEAPLHKAHEYRATVPGIANNHLLDYYVRAEDENGTVSRSPIQHVYVGPFGGGGGGNGWLIDGVLDDGARLLYEQGEFALWGGLRGDSLYVAATAAPILGEDVFIVISELPGPMQGAMWAKAGQVAGWDLFIGNESTNNWSGPFDNQSVVETASGSVVEAMIHISQEWPDGLDGLYFFAAIYETPDGGSLTGQLPIGDNDDLVPVGEWAYRGFASFRWY